MTYGVLDLNFNIFSRRTCHGYITYRFHLHIGLNQKEEKEHDGAAWACLRKQNFSDGFQPFHHKKPSWDSLGQEDQVFNQAYKIKQRDGRTWSSSSLKMEFKNNANSWAQAKRLKATLKWITFIPRPFGTLGKECWLLK